MAKLVCTVELDKSAGLTVTIENASASVTQTIKVNGTTIELKVAGPSGASTITQGAEKVAIVCKQFEVTAEQTISLKSTGASTWHSDSSVELSAAQKLSASTQGTLDLKGTQAAMKADAVLDLQSAATATLKGQLTNVQGSLVTIS